MGYLIDSASYLGLFLCVSMTALVFYVYSNIVYYKIYSEGYSVMFQTALTIIKMNSEKISTLEDPIEIFQILQNMPRRLIDCHQFMNVSFFFFL